MRPIGFDEVHAETRTLDEHIARRMAPAAPDFPYFGHLRDLLTETLHGESIRLSHRWTSEDLESLAALVVICPAEPAIAPVTGGQPIFASNEISELVAYVEGGGGLLVLGEWAISRWGGNLNEVLSPFSLSFSDDTVHVPTSGPRAHVLARDFKCTDISDHAVTLGVEAITFHQGCAVKCDDQASIVRAPNGYTVAAARNVGSGRVVVIGDTDLFAMPRIGLEDNAQFFVRVASWVSRSEPPASMERAIETVLGRKLYALREFAATENLALVSGAHLVDTAPYRDELAELAAPLAGSSPYGEEDEWFERAEMTFHAMPEPVRRAVVRFRHRSNDYGVLLLRGLPSDPELPGTPADGGRSREKCTFYSEFWLSAFGSALGDPISYAQQKKGELFQTVAPTRGHERLLSSDSSESLLDFHTETAFHPFLPTYVLLYCLRPDHESNARTFVASTRMMIQEIPLRARAALFQDVYLTGIDYSFGALSVGDGHGPTVPVLFGNPYDPFIKFDLDLMVGTTEAAAQALGATKQAANSCKRWVILNEGDLLIIDNRRAVHGRSSFTPRYDGNDRWLQRLYVMRDLALAEEERRHNERIIDLEFRT